MILFPFKANWKLFQSQLLNTVCPRSSDPFYIVIYYIKWVTTSWTIGQLQISIFFTDRSYLAFSLVDCIWFWVTTAWIRNPGFWCLAWFLHKIFFGHLLSFYPTFIARGADSFYESAGIAIYGVGYGDAFFCDHNHLL